MSFATYPSLRDAVVYITGGASGIGAEMVRAFAEQGSRVGFVDIAEDLGRRLAAELVEAKRRVHFEFLRSPRHRRLKAAFARLKSAIGPAGVLVNNAASDDRHGWRDVTPEYYDDRIATNVRHMFFATQFVAPDMIAARKGSIINFGSNSWFEKFGRLAGLHHRQGRGARNDPLVRARPRPLSHPRQHFGPRLDHDRAAKDPMDDAQTIERQLARQCLPDLIEPVYVARMALFLAADDFAMCTANNYMVEAGSI